MLLSLLELFEDPVGAPFCKCPSLSDGANPGNGCADGTIRTNTDDVAPYFAIADEPDWKFLRPDS
jgi:hypothetical protein